MKKYLAAMALIALATNASASNDSKWAGSGTVYGLDGDQTSTYQLELSVTHQSSTESQQTVNITLPSGGTETVVSQSTESGNGFEIVTDTMKGGGFCFSANLCTIYLENPDTGLAYASTLVKDGDQQMRQLRTELKQGKAQRFFVETFVRIE